MSHGGGASPLRAIVYAFLANLGIALAKAVAAFFTGSGALLAEAIHSFADTGNQLLLVLGLRQAGRAPDAEHPLGYGKSTYFWSFLVAVLLFSVGGLFSLYEGWHKLMAPEPLSNLAVGFGVLGVSIVLESVSLRGCLREVAHLRGEKSLWQWLRATRSGELMVVFGEDVAALAGLAVATGFLALAAASGDARYDAFGSMAIGAILIAVAVMLAARIRHLLLGSSADPDLVADLRAEIESDPNIAEVYNLVTIQIGNGVMLAVKIRMHGNPPLNDAIDSINAMERRVKERFPDVTWSFVEPDVED